MVQGTRTFTSVAELEGGVGARPPLLLVEDEIPSLLAEYHGEMSDPSGRWVPYPSLKAPLWGEERGTNSALAKVFRE